MPSVPSSELNPRSFAAVPSSGAESMRVPDSSNICAYLELDDAEHRDSLARYGCCRVHYLAKSVGGRECMGENNQGVSHSAEAAALGFYFQAFFALLTLLAQDTDNAAIGVEQLDDVDLKADGRTLLFQLKHSISAAPPPITLKSRALWRTIKAWIDVLPALTLSETTLHLVAVASIPSDSPLTALTSEDANRDFIVGAMVKRRSKLSTPVRPRLSRANQRLTRTGSTGARPSSRSPKQSDRISSAARSSNRTAPRSAR